MNNNIFAGIMGHVFGGPRVIVSAMGTSKRVQFRFPRCKSRRIHKKFKKREENFKIEYISYKFRDPSSFHDVLVIHPAVEAKLKQLPVAVVSTPPKLPKLAASPVKPRMDFGMPVLRSPGFICLANITA